MLILTSAQAKHAVRPPAVGYNVAVPLKQNVASKHQKEWNKNKEKNM